MKKTISNKIKQLIDCNNNKNKTNSNYNFVCFVLNSQNTKYFKNVLHTQKQYKKNNKILLCKDKIKKQRTNKQTNKQTKKPEYIPNGLN